MHLRTDCPQQKEAVALSAKTKTMDGIQIDQNMNAVDTNNDPIPGLYVVGNDSGGYFSGTYPNLSTGAACGRTVTFGRRAGRIAATEGI